MEVSTWNPAHCDSMSNRRGRIRITECQSHHQRCASPPTITTSPDEWLQECLKQLKMHKDVGPRTCWHQEVLPVARKGQCRQRLWLLLTGLSSRSTETGAYPSWHDLSCRFCKGVPRRHLAHSRKPPCWRIWGLEVLLHFQFHTKTAAADQLTKHIGY